MAIPALTLLLSPTHRVQQGGTKYAEARSAIGRVASSVPIQHVVIIMQENRSFDSYFGTYPGAEGIPMRSGVPTVCCNDARTGECVKPYHDSRDVNYDADHSAQAAVLDVHGGRMDGFLHQDTGRAPHPGVVGTMGYHDAREIPNYWAYARNFTLLDHLFEPNASWSLPSHLFLVSEWSAVCSKKDNPASCSNALQKYSLTNHAWTDLTYLLYKNQVSWAYYITEGLTPDSDDGSDVFQPHQQSVKTPDIWNPLPAFTTVKQDGQLGNIQPLKEFFSAIKSGTLPQVVWIVPDAAHSEHPLQKISDGQAHVTRVINALMSSPYWNSTAIFVSWDDWGGFYDHVPPVKVDENGYGLRVPGLVISPYVKPGAIDKQVLSFDAYAKFIEDLFMNHQRLDPKTDGRPDPRPTVRENVAQLGDLMSDFDFTQTPLPPLILQPYPQRR